MSKHCFSPVRTLRSTLSLAVSSLTALGLLTATAGITWGQSPDVMTIEEDWELVLAAPATIKTAPQLETVISPVGNIDSVFARTTWNYREQPEFLPGGMQLQAWCGDQCLARTNFGTNDLSTVSETVTWTQTLQTDGSVLTLTIANGQSTTWGSFGGSTLTLQGVVDLSDLEGYSTDVSVDNSGITFGSNRVVLLRIKEVRRFAADGTLLSSDTAPRIVYPQD